MDESTIHGSCLCGEVTFEVDPPFHKMVHCHCSRCRKATGTGHATNLGRSRATQVADRRGQYHALRPSHGKKLRQVVLRPLRQPSPTPHPQRQATGHSRGIAERGTADQP